MTTPTVSKSPSYSTGSPALRAVFLRRVRLAALSTCVLSAAAVAQVPTPAEHLGRPVGADFELADWSEVGGYFRRLAEQSPRVTTEVVGTTTEGRDFLLSVISSEANLARLPAIRAASARLADPRGASDEELARIVAEEPLVAFVSCGMHSTETAAPQFSMEFAHALATSDEEPWRTAREELVLLIAPCLNPDGLDRVVAWYRETVGTEFESTGLLELYQRYAGHDNNRDWFALTQAETRVVTKLLYSDWHPQVYWDVHEQGSDRERMFVPPFRDPLNPNLDGGVIAGIGALGANALYDMTRAGLTGISTGVSYDMWWNGGNRNVPVRHNIIGLLTEAASVDIATPVFLPIDRLRGPRGLNAYAPSNRFPVPWPGGWWRLRDVLDYELAFGRSLVDSLSRDRERWLSGALDAAARAVERGRTDAPRAWILPSDDQDRGAARRLVELLLLGGVDVFVADEPLEADGRTWPAGSVVVPRDQPYGAHVKDLFEVQRYPDGEPPYDVAGWTLPYLFGLHRVEVVAPLEAELRPVRTAADALAGFAPLDDGSRWSARESDRWRDLFAALARGETFTFFGEGEDAGHFVPGVAPEDAGSEPDGEAAPWSRALTGLPRVGVYAPWRGSMDEGWIRWVFDTAGLPFERVRNEMLRAGRLDRFLDVLVLPDVGGGQLDRGRRPGSVPSEYAGGLDPEGAVAVEEFVRAGGTLVSVGRSAGWTIELLDLPLEDALAAPEAEEFACPGSVLRGVPSADRPRAGGLPASVPLFFAWGGAAWSLEEDSAAETLLQYAPRRVLLSGWIREAEALQGKSAWVRAEHGEGVVHLFGFRPHYRGWSQGTFQLLFRAILLDGAPR